MLRRLHGGPANAGPGRDRLDRQIANAMMLDLASDDAQDGPLTLGIVVPQMVREGAGTAQHPSAVT
jgi:hypothetical protein